MEVPTEASERPSGHDSPDCRGPGRLTGNCQLRKLSLSSVLSCFLKYVKASLLRLTENLLCFCFHVFSPEVFYMKRGLTFTRAVDMICSPRHFMRISRSVYRYRTRQLPPEKFPIFLCCHLLWIHFTMWTEKNASC